MSNKEIDGIEGLVFNESKVQGTFWYTLLLINNDYQTVLTLIFQSYQD